MPRPHIPIPIDYVTFRLDVLVTIAKDDASEVYEHETGVSLHDLRVLRNVAITPGLMQGALVELCYIEKTSVSKRVAALVSRGLLKRETGEADARQVRLSLTSLGQDVVSRCEPLGRRLERDMLSTLSADERKIFETCIDKVTTQLLFQREAAGVHDAPRLRR